MNVKTVINEKDKHSNGKTEERTPLESAALSHKGILKIEGPATRIEQENHNANHVLNYVALVTLSITHEIRRKASSETAERVQAHLSCLREFIEEEDLELNAAVDRLLKSLAVKLPAVDTDWIAFIAGHSKELQILAQRYGGLKNQELSRMADLHKNQQWIRIWWWRVVIRNCMRRFHPRRAVEVKGAIGNFRNRAFKRFQMTQKKTVTADARQTKEFFMSLISNVTCVMEFKIIRRESYLNGKATYAETARDQILHFLYFIKHHYPPPPKTGELLWAACDYLNDYFGKFPQVSEERSEKALKEMDNLCQAIGISYGHKFDSKEKRETKKP